MKSLNLRLVILFGCLFVSGGLLPAMAAQPQSGGDQPPNIIFIMADDLGYAGVGSYGQVKMDTPNLDRLTKQGMRFTQAYAGESVCAPARSTLMTGQHVGHTPVRSNGSNMFLSDEDVTVAELLKEAGYATGGFGKWGLGNNHTPGRPTNQGFDTFVGQLHQVHAHFYYPFWIWNNEEKMMLPGNRGGKHGQYVAEVIHQKALDFIRENKDGPFFAYLPTTLPHVELAVPEKYEAPYRDRFPKITIDDPRKDYIDSHHAYATYAGMVTLLDHQVGEVLALLDELGIAQNTLVIFTSDNGAQGGDTFGPLEEFFDGNGPFRGVKRTMYEGGIRVPMIARWPGRIKPGSITDHRCYFPDVLPTLAEVAGVGDRVSGSIDGISFLPTLRGEREQKEHDFMFWANSGHTGDPRRIGARMGDWWKAVQPDGSDGPTELYNLKRDLAEMHDVADENPEIVEKIKAEMKEAWTPRRDFDVTGRPSTYKYIETAEHKGEEDE